MLVFEEIAWTEVLREEAKKFFLSRAGKAFLTDLYVQYQGRMEGLVTMDFKEPQAALRAIEVQSEARMAYGILESVEQLIKETENG